MIIPLIEYKNYGKTYSYHLCLNYDRWYDESEILLETKEICQIRRIKQIKQSHYEKRFELPDLEIIDEFQLIAKINTKYSDEILNIKVENNDWDGFIKKLGIES